jgi:hypothetical protein
VTPFENFIKARWAISNFGKMTGQWIRDFLKILQKRMLKPSAPPCLGEALRRGILIKIGHFPFPKTKLTRIEKTPNPGILQALISVSRQNGLQFSENEALFDRKLLDYLP